MGGSSSRIEKNEALHLCKERKRFIKQAVDSRCDLTGAHISYIQSLKSVGSALRGFAATETDDPSHSHSHSHSAAYPSPSPSDENENENEIPHSPTNTNNVVNYMRASSGTTNAVTVTLHPSMNSFVEEGEDQSLSFPPPPPPPPPDLHGHSWDYFDSAGAAEEEGSSWFAAAAARRGDSGGGMLDHVGKLATRRRGIDSGNNVVAVEGGGELVKAECGNGAVRRSGLDGNGGLEEGRRSSKREKRSGAEMSFDTEREDPSEFITHRAKDFLSSIRDIGNRFFRASESGKEVFRMLEANKIRLRCSKPEGRSSTSVFVEALHIVCCKGEKNLANGPPPQQITRVTWSRSVSSQSSSSKNLLTSASKGDVDDSGSDFVEEYSMITGSHSSTLDRIFAWERKLYDEVKASESIKKDYDQRCNQLRHLFAKDANSHVIDKTRAVVKDLHSQLRVALHAVDSIAKRIEKLRDEELQPQLLELIQGFTRMWKDMLECHHAQYITISLAYHAKISTGPMDRESHRQVCLQLEHEIECFGVSFANWIAAHQSYVEALNGWLQTCIILPQERSNRRRAFSPRRDLAPSIFVLCRDWAAGTKGLPAEEVTNAIKGFASELHVTRQVEEEQHETRVETNHEGSAENNGETESREDESSNQSCNMSSIQASLVKLLDKLTKFAEASRKMYEEIRQSAEAAQVAYTNCRMIRF
ncbi:hypothetical protein Sjap_022220 [Stephania japonica]|uniref:BZIP transcription factor n=1 Tax=Stephania japonica TaxID=461633 RepID=A0AAP0EU73_9MAGN